MSHFIPGLQLSGLFYSEVVQPILNAEFPDLAYSAALIGDGSEVLGFDTEMSSDHGWGPRLRLFLNEEDYARITQDIEETLRQRLPHTFRGYSTHFSPPDVDDNGTQMLETIESGPVNHRVEIHTLRGFVQAHLGFDLQDDITPADWLTFPEQKLRTLTAGAVYHDGIGLQSVRNRFAYYPHDVWLYLMAAGWNRIGQEDHLMGRAGYVGDEIGSAIIGARLVRDMMRLCFLMERQYAPYPKWFGTAFSRLKCAGELSPSLKRALSAEAWQEREAYLCAAYEKVAAMHNALQLTEPQPEKVSHFFGRPFKVIGGSFVTALLARISDPEMMHMVQNRLIGSIDQFSDNTDLLSDPLWRPVLRNLY